MDQPVENVYRNREFDRSEEFKRKMGERVVKLDWKTIPFYRKYTFLRIFGWLGFMLPIITLIYVPIILILIWKTGPTFSCKSYGDGHYPVVYRHKKYTLLAVGLLMLLLHLAAVAYPFFTGEF